MAEDVRTVRLRNIEQYRTWVAAHPHRQVVSVALVAEGLRSFLLVTYTESARHLCSCARRRGRRPIEMRPRRRTLATIRRI
jgi:hypothetical protein